MRARHPALLLAAALLLQLSPARASDIGVAPVAVELGGINDRATLSVVNNGADPVIMQAEAVDWNNGDPGLDTPSAAVVINPPVFSIAPGRTQLVRVGLRRAAPVEREATYRIVLREVPAAPRPGEVRISGQVRVLMALRVPVYVAPSRVVQQPRWVATQAPDGSVVAQLTNDGNVHVRVGAIRLRAAAGDAAGAPRDAPAVVLAGESRSFRLRGASTDPRPLTVDIDTDHGPQSLPVALASR